MHNNISHQYFCGTTIFPINTFVALLITSQPEARPTCAAWPVEAAWPVILGKT
jgi:hypothetical protein